MPHKLINPFYYTIKPLMPRNVQIFLRRQWAKYKLQFHAHHWPIDPVSSKVPENWQGWPDGKRFAVVLSHDVDTKRGYDNVLKLAALEEKMGFRSSFNFVPERYGKVSLALLAALKERGFDIGVHGLKHDGKLFLSRNRFNRQAVRINDYLNAWNCGGFTSPSMHHNLKWLSDLNIDYSISTFDTDPFEPQPDAVRTIYPFWVANGTPETGFVEMPYTLPQDFTLFVILQEKTIDIWKKKLDWVAQNGGMVLLNTHPDYMAFSDRDKAPMLYPVEWYEELLNYLNKRYEDHFYHRKPIDIARVIKARSIPSSSVVSDRIELKGLKPEIASSIGSSEKQPISASRPIGRLNRKHVLFIVENNTVPPDIRVWREANAVRDAGFYVSIIAPKNATYTKRYEVIEGIEIYRHPVMECTRGFTSQLLEYANAFIWETLFSAYLIINKPFHVIHAANPPDNIVILAIFYKIFGIKFIFDHHDLAPELYKAKFKEPNHIVYKLLRIFEKLSCLVADAIISTNESYKNHVIDLHQVDENKITIVRNDPELALTQIAQQNKNPEKKDRVDILYLGAINSQDGVDLLIEIAHRLVYHHKKHNFLCTVIGDGEKLEDIKSLARKKGIEKYLRFTGYIYDRNLINQYLSNADICVETAPDNEANRKSTFIKIMEYMAFGKPIVAFNLKETSTTVQDTAILIDIGNIESFSAKLAVLIEDKSLRKKIGNKAKGRIVKRLNWDVASRNLNDAYLSIGKLIASPNKLFIHKKI